MEKYKITCKNCEHSDVVCITSEGQVIWGKNTYIVSARKRLDGNWGWQCMCGNYSLMTAQEDTITNKQTPDPQEIEDIIKSLIVEPDNKFAMEAF